MPVIYKYNRNNTPELSISNEKSIIKNFRGRYMYRSHKFDYLPEI